MLPIYLFDKSSFQKERSPNAFSDLEKFNKGTKTFPRENTKLSNGVPKFELPQGLRLSVLRLSELELSLKSFE